MIISSWKEEYKNFIFSKLTSCQVDYSIHTSTNNKTIVSFTKYFMSIVSVDDLKHCSVTFNGKTYIRIMKFSVLNKYCSIDVISAVHEVSEGIYGLDSVSLYQLNVNVEN